MRPRFAPAKLSLILLRVQPFYAAAHTLPICHKKIEPMRHTPRLSPSGFGFLLAFFLLPFGLSATHNRAGEIHVEQIGGCNSLTVRATIITWTRTSSVNADRDTLTICWGDGNCQSVKRSNGNGNGQPLAGDIKYNLYIAEHTYAGPATYRISMTDPNRIAGIINVNPPSSDNVQFHIETIYTFQDPQFGGCNTTPFLLQPPVDVACVGRPFKHNPNAFDPDGDSLSYKLIVPRADLGSPVPNYSYPNQISPGANNILQLDPVTGDLLWYSPQQRGEYNLAIIIVSWRNGAPIDTTIRDMQIRVETCDNNPPDVKALDKICVIAGDTVEFTVTATDPDTADLVQLTALGGPFDPTYQAATFDAPTGFNLPLVSGKFRWETRCEHISDQEYSVVFKAVDSLNKTTPMLADLKTVQIKVVGPPPEDVQADAEFGYAEITWQKPYTCETTVNDYFYGFSVWRREGSNPFPPDTCRPGLAGRGYTQIVFFTKAEKDGRYYFKDTTVQRGRTYCYRILGKFARVSSGGYPYNLVESLPSEEVCVQLPRDLPLITNVSVLETDAANGEIEVRWSKPIAGDLDTTINHGPYRYQVRRVAGFAQAGLADVPGGSLVSDWFSTANDTFFIDKNLNTDGQPYTYEVAFYTRGNAEPLGKTNTASSVFLKIASTDNTNTLTWEERVPWGNYRYVIYRRDNQSGQFDSIGTTAMRRFVDKNLQNGTEYCYYVRSIGTYSIGGVVNPIINLSQRDCGIPLDTVPPCPPELTVGNLCTTGNPTLPDPPFENNLTWTNPNLACLTTDDVVQYRVFFKPSENEQFTQIEILDGAMNTSFVHTIESGLAGCYAVSALDSLGNESLKSTTVCVDNCPEYVLPNAFTPDGDDANETFRPFPGWRFVASVDMQIFNRWGNLVFETTDPAINWTGKTKDGKDLAAGTYFYVCRVFEYRVDGIVPRPDVLSGFIELVRGQ